MSKKEKKIEQPDRILEIIKKNIDFNIEIQKTTRKRLKNTNTRSNAL